MFSTRREIIRLVEKLSRAPLERIAALGLADALGDPLAAPLFADIFAAEPQLSSEGHCFPQHVACGIVDTALEYRFEDLRARRTRQLFRQMESIVFLPPHSESTRQLRNEVVRRSWEIYRGFLALEQLMEERVLNALELSAFVEDFLQAMTGQCEVLVSLMRWRLQSHSDAQRGRLLRQICQATKEGLKNDPLPESALLTDLSSPVRFRRANLENPDFWNTATRVEEYLFDALCPRLQ
ncbi:MAG: hypothetical protein U0136_02295 [Bdellovibrionota bacterium]